MLQVWHCLLFGVGKKVDSWQIGRNDDSVSVSNVGAVYGKDQTSTRTIIRNSFPVQLDAVNQTDIKNSYHNYSIDKQKQADNNHNTVAADVNRLIICFPAESSGGKINFLPRRIGICAFFS